MFLVIEACLTVSAFDVMIKSYTRRY